MLSSGEVFPVNASKVCQTALRTILHLDLQSTSSRRNFSSAEGCLKNDRCGQPVTVATEQTVAKVKCLMKEDPKITENVIRDSFNLSSGSLNWILRHHLCVWKRCVVRCPASWPTNRRRVGWSGAFTCFETLSQAS